MARDYSLDFGEPYDFDEKDKKIIKELQEDARQSIADIARNTGLSRDVVKYRIDKLEEENVIRFYHAFLNPGKIGKPMYGYFLFTLSNYSTEDEEAFRNYLVQLDNISYVGKFSGAWDYAAMICAEDFREADKVLENIRKEFNHIIKEVDRGHIVEEYKYEYMADMIDT